MSEKSSNGLSKLKNRCDNCGSVTSKTFWDYRDGSVLCDSCHKVKGDNWQKKVDKKLKSIDIIKEIKCKCNQCGCIWHYLDEDQRKIEKQAVNNAMIGCGMCCNPFGALFSNKSLDLQRELDKMKKCPKCNSSDVIKTVIYHEKKE